MSDSDCDIVEVKRRKIDNGEKNEKEEGKKDEDKSPLRLNRVKRSNDNVDAVSLEELLGQQDLVEMYQFSFVMDVPFAMGCLNPRARDKVKAHFVFDKNGEEEVKRSLVVARELGSENITLDPIYVKKYGTHHTKLMVLVFPTQVQITVHTANLIPFDWENMTQGIWVSPRLDIGGGDCSESQFKTDFTQYLRAYNTPKLNELAGFLEERVDFSPIRNVAFIASVPGNYYPERYGKANPDYKKWGVVKLQKLVAETNHEDEGDEEIIIQMSSIGTLNQLKSYFDPIIAKALKGEEILSATDSKPSPNIKIIFPTVTDIERSYYGYLSGSTIHFKGTNPRQQQLLTQLKPMLCRWNSVKAGRDKAAPHIKTYMRTCKQGQKIAWALLTSANLSTQAWGIVAKKNKNQWIQSWEAGIFMYPETKEGFTPCYKADSSNNGSNPLRLPFDLPLTNYTSNDEIWAT